MAYDYDKDFVTPSATALHLAGFHRARLKGYAQLANRHFHHWQLWLDVGCHCGHFFRFLPHSGGSRLGGDVATHALAYAKKQQPQVHWVCMSATDLALPDGRCQVVSLLELLGLLSPAQQKGVLAETRRVLQPGGWLLVAIPMGQNSQLMNEESLHQLLANDFILMEKQYYSFYYFEGITQKLRPWRDRLDYYSHILALFINTPPPLRPACCGKYYYFAPATFL
ncbi:MAG: class I SAM-dependent methyltransferase [Magnetococcales bacterium]|nr:class I SAM-dependent methyltransferase [Magnetococcales bacterium]NGZ27025.1 class I SAM-dependent methyltransferase [Magnetococcales bacterium]